MFRVMSALLVLAVLLALPGGRAAAQVEVAANEWDESTPTGWWWYYNQSVDDIKDKIDTLHVRIVDLEVQQTSPLRFAVAFVENDGVYASGWWWYFGLDEAGVSSYLDQNDARLIDLEVYEAGGQLLFAPVMVANTGAAAKAWWWYYGLTPQGILDKADLHDARAIDVERYELNGQTAYAAVYIRNTGDDQRGWWVYINQSHAEVNQKIADHNARLIDIWHQPDGDLGIVMQSCPCPASWWYVGVTEAELNQVTRQNGARIVDLDTYVVNNQRYFAAALINNEGPITTRVGAMLRAHIVQPNGLYGDASAGLYLKRVGGPALAGLYETRVFEPASTVKVLPHLYALRRVAEGFADLDDEVIRYLYAPSSCPGLNSNGTEPLTTALTEMMQDSDNARTRAVIDTFGRANINSFAASAGLNDTALNHTLGCGADAIANPNAMTLVDAARIYEGVADSTLLPGAYQEPFFAAMAGKDYDFSGAWDAASAIVDQEAPPAMPAAARQAFKDRMRLSYKAGGYTLCLGGGCNPRQEYRSIAGIATIPFCGTRLARIVFPTQFVFGIFVDKATDPVQADAAFNETKAELLREQIHAALEDWQPCAFQQHMPGVQG